MQCHLEKAKMQADIKQYNRQREKLFVSLKFCWHHGITVGNKDSEVRVKYLSKHTKFQKWKTDKEYADSEILKKAI